MSLLDAIRSGDRAAAWAAYRQSVAEWRAANAAWQAEHQARVAEEVADDLRQVVGLLALAYAGDGQAGEP